MFYIDMKKSLSDTLWIIIRVTGLLCVLFSLPFLPKAYSSHHFSELFSEYTHISSVAEEGSPHYNSEKNRQMMHYRSEAMTQMYVALTRFIVLFVLGLYSLIDGRLIHRLLSPPKPKSESNNSVETTA